MRNAQFPLQRIVLLFLLLVTYWWPSFAIGQAAPRFDLENLRRQDGNLTRAYDIAGIQNAWEEIVSTTLPVVSVKVGIADSGIDAGHPEFNSPAVQLGPIDRSLLSDSNPDKGHGTPVSGIVGANNVSASSVLPSDSPQMNGVLAGVRNMNYALNIQPYGTVLTPTTTVVISVFDAVESLIKQGNQVINMSFSMAPCSVLPTFNKRKGENRCFTTDQEFLDVFDEWKRLFEQSTSSTLFVSAAGNDDIDASLALPAALSLLKNVMTVGATDLSDQRASFRFPDKSNYSSNVNMSAPGIGVYAPAIRGRGDFPNTGPEAKNYFTDFGGTSAAAPLVSGVAGLLKALEPAYTASHPGQALTPAKIKEILMHNADPLYAPTGSNEAGKSLGSGCEQNGTPPPGQVFRGCRLNALRAVKAVLPSPSPSPTPSPTPTPSPQLCNHGTPACEPYLGDTCTVCPECAGDFQCVVTQIICNRFNFVGGKPGPVYDQCRNEAFAWLLSFLDNLSVKYADPTRNVQDLGASTPNLIDGICNQHFNPVFGCGGFPTESCLSNSADCGPCPTIANISDLHISQGSCDQTLCSDSVCSAVSPQCDNPLACQYNCDSAHYGGSFCDAPDNIQSFAVDFLVPNPAICNELRIRSDTICSTDANFISYNAADGSGFETVRNPLTGMPLDTLHVGIGTSPEGGSPQCVASPDRLGAETPCPL